MANEISANNIKQSYDLAENKIFPKTTINGIVFDSDDSVVGSSAIVKSLVNEDLLVKNIEVNCDSSTGGYIHLKTNNGDESGVSVLELKLGHRGLDTSTANKIYINDAIETNTDVSAFFNNVEIASKCVNATYDNLQVRCGKFVAKYNDGSIVINKGGVSANEFSIIKEGHEHGVLTTWMDSICLDGGGNGVMLNGFYGAALGKNSYYGQFYADGSALTLNCMKGYANGVIDVSVSTLGKLSATYEKGVDLATKGLINLKTNECVITGGGLVSELNIVQNLDAEQGGDRLRIYLDSSNANQFNFGLGVNINSYQFNYDDILKYSMIKSGTANLKLAVYDYGRDGSISGSGYVTISSDDMHLKANDISFDSTRVYGTVNNEHDVLMGVPIGSVVKWIADSSIPEGWTKKDNVGKYAGIVMVDKTKDEYSYTRCVASVKQILPGMVDSGSGVSRPGTWGYCFDTNNVVELTKDKFDEYIKIRTGRILCKAGCKIGSVMITKDNSTNYDFYHVFSLNETTKRLADMLKYYEATSFSSKIYTDDASGAVRCKFGQKNVNNTSLSVGWFYTGGAAKYVLTLFMTNFDEGSQGSQTEYEPEAYYTTDKNAIKSGNVIFSEYINMRSWDDYEIMKCE